MNNDELMEKLKQDMEMRNFLPYTKDFYIRKTREMIKYLNQWGRIQMVIKNITICMRPHWLSYNKKGN